jgi:hypothetical protein
MSTEVVTVDADVDLHSVFGLFRSHVRQRTGWSQRKWYLTKNCSPPALTRWKVCEP